MSTDSVCHRKMRAKRERIKRCALCTEKFSLSKRTHFMWFRNWILGLILSGLYLNGLLFLLEASLLLEASPIGNFSLIGVLIRECSMADYAGREKIHYIRRQIWGGKKILLYNAPEFVERQEKRKNLLLVSSFCLYRSSKWDLEWDSEWGSESLKQFWIWNFFIWSLAWYPVTGSLFEGEPRAASTGEDK